MPGRPTVQTVCLYCYSSFSRSSLGTLFCKCLRFPTFRGTFFAVFHVVHQALIANVCGFALFRALSLYFPCTSPVTFYSLKERAWQPSWRLFCRPVLSGEVPYSCQAEPEHPASLLPWFNSLYDMCPVQWNNMETHWPPCQSPKIALCRKLSFLGSYFIPVHYKYARTTTAWLEWNIYLKGIDTFSIRSLSQKSLWQIIWNGRKGRVWKKGTIRFLAGCWVWLKYENAILGKTHQWLLFEPWEEFFWRIVFPFWGILDNRLFPPKNQTPPLQDLKISFFPNPLCL